MSSKIDLILGVVMRKVFIGLIFILLIALVGCESSLVVDSLASPGRSVTTIGNSNQSLATGSLSTSDTADFIQVTVPNGLVGDLVYFELLGANLRLSLYNSSRTLVRESNGSDFFGDPGFGLSSTNLNSEAISVTRVCRGPCIIAEKGVGTVFLKIEAKIAGTSADYELYSYGDPYGDGEEPENNDCGALSNSAIIPIPIDQVFEGALEAVEDVDCYQSNGAISSIALQLNANTTINVKAEIFTLAGAPYPNDSNNTLRATAGSTIKQILTISPVREVIVRVTTDNNRAASTGNSKYELSFETP